MGWTLHGSIAPLSFIGQIPNSSRPLRNALPFPVWVLTLWAWLPLRWPGKTQKEVYIISMSKTGAEVHFRKHFNWWRITLRWALQLIVIFCYCTCKVQTFWEVLCTAGKSAMQMPRWSQWSASSGNLPVPSGQHWEMHLKCLAWLPLLRVAKAPRPLSNSQVVHVRGLLSCRPLENPAKKQLLNGEKSSRPVELASFAESDFTARAAAQSLIDAPGRWSLRNSDKVIKRLLATCADCAVAARWLNWDWSCIYYPPTFTVVRGSIVHSSQIWYYDLATISWSNSMLIGCTPEACHGTWK